MKKKRRRPERVIVIKEATDLPASSAYVDVTAAGKTAFGVRVSGRSIVRCREAVQREFSELRAFVARTERKPPAPSEGKD